MHSGIIIAGDHVHNSWLSVLPPLTALIGAVLTKRVVPSLVLALLVGSALISQSALLAFVKAASYITGSISSKENASIIAFLFLFGALTEIIKLSGGIKGFARLAERYIISERGALWSVWFLSLITFLDCCFHVIAVGKITRPILEKVSGSTEKLAMLINITSSQLVVMIPIATTYVGYIIGVIASAMRSSGVQGNPYSLYLKSLPFNFYSIGMIAVGFLLIYWEPGFGKWFKSNMASEKDGIHNEHEGEEQCAFEEMAKPRPLNLVLPIGLVLALILSLIWWTGKGGSRGLFAAFTHADFEKSIFIAVFSALIITFTAYRMQGVPFAELDSHLLKGGTELLPPIVILVLSWSLSTVTHDLGFNGFISTIMHAVPPPAIPVFVFLISGVMSYFIGSSWATWALMIPLGIPLAFTSGISVPFIIGCILAGGSIGDNVSPLGETPILTASITGIPLVKHVQSLLPYAVIVSIITILLYLGFMLIGFS